MEDKIRKYPRIIDADPLKDLYHTGIINLNQIQGYRQITY